MYNEGVVPNSMQLSETEKLDKDNGKGGTLQIRLVNKLCPLGKLYFSRVWGFNRRRRYDCSYGYARKRRREQAMLVQTTAAWRVRELGLSYSQDLHDATNAFPSVVQDRLDGMLREVLGYRKSRIMIHRHRQSRMVIRCDAVSYTHLTLPTKA